MNKNFVLLILSVALLSGCNRLDIAYSWIDTFMVARVDSYFDISSKQSRELKASINKDLKAIQASVLPKVIENMKDIEKDVAKDQLQKERIAEHFTQFLGEFEKLHGYFAQTASEFVGGASPQQISNFEKSFSKKIQEDLQKAQNSAKHLKDARKKYVNWFETFLGNLSKEQQAAIDSHLKRSPFPMELRVRSKAHAVSQFLEHRDSSKDLQAFVVAYYNDPFKYDLPEFQKAFTNYQTDLKGLLTEVLEQISPEQKKYLQRSLAKKIQQLQKISERT